MSQAKNALEAAAAALEEVSARTHSVVRGRVGRVQVEFKLQRSASWRVRAWHVPVPIALDIFEHAHTGSRGPGIDLDANELEQRYCVDGAPEAAVMEVLSPDVQQRILTLAPKRLLIDRRGVRITKRYHVYFAEPVAIAGAIELCVLLCRRVVEATGAVDRAMTLAASADGGQPYRADASTTALATTRNQHNQAIEAVSRRALWRWDKKRTRNGILLTLWMAVTALFLLLGNGVI